MRKFLMSIVMMAFFGLAKADEGMWMICNISARTDSVLQSLGLELTPEQIYSDGQPSLNNAIVMFGGFCSGVVVSPNGLVFTNHHCGYGTIQTHSTTKHDYLKYGFYAKKQKDEIPTPDLYVSFHLRTVEVTDQVMADVTDAMDEQARSAAIEAAADKLTEAVKDSVNGIYAQVVPYYRGSKYYMSVYQRFDDVRLVCAPPESLGKFGGDTDNWVWPRQTCDFSVFRIYAGPNNLPAAYSEDNVPYKTDSYAHVSTQGYQNGSFCMTFGYPGSTSRYMSSYGIVNMMENENKPRAQVRGVKQDIWKEAMNASDDIRIKYSSKYAESSNYWKNAIGMNESIERFGVLDEKRAFEKELNEWIMSDTVAHAKYIGVLDSLKAEYASTAEGNLVATLFEETLTGSDLLMLSFQGLMSIFNGGGDFQKQAKETYKDIDFDLDRRTLAALLRNYAEQVPSEDYLMSFYSTIKDQFGGDYDAYLKDVYSRSSFTKPDVIFKTEKVSELTEDPLMQLSYGMLGTLFKLRGSFDNNINLYERNLEDAMREMNKDKEYYPDANFTLRMSYGIVEGYSPDKETVYDYYTKSSSLLEKNVKFPDNLDYTLIPAVKKWLAKGKFGKQYIDKTTGTMNLCFLTNNDITGGNSGSGMFDGKGRLIGLAFDGNYEALSSDIMFNNSLTRCIGVDIRYVLSVIETYSKGKRIMNELTIE
ncbi:MAG: S46 family peptidase [Bacteroidaceae bacterium]|nr:S46 family peptidase [Bacteroidaceae bacterium]